jgi:hypothetical protein
MYSGARAVLGLRRFPSTTFQANLFGMQRWLPPLSTADLIVLGVTLALILSASRIGWAADLLERVFRRRRR